MLLQAGEAAAAGAEEAAGTGRSLAGVVAVPMMWEGADGEDEDEEKGEVERALGGAGCRAGDQ